MRHVWHLVLAEHLEAIVGVFNWPNFNIVYQGIGSPEKRERDGEMAVWRSGQSTEYLSTKWEAVFFILILV